MTTFYTSDLHFGHAKIIDYREGPWETVDEHDEDLMTRWNETVSPTDRVYVLGDFALGRRTKTVPMALKLNGRKFLVPGNHDSNWRNYTRSSKSYDNRQSLYTESGLARLPETFNCVLGGHKTTICHFPFRGEGKKKEEGQEDYISKHFDHMPVDEGQWLVHGHVHDAWKQKGRQINVGVDVWDLRPVALDTIISLMDEGDPNEK